MGSLMMNGTNVSKVIIIKISIETRVLDYII